MENLADGAADAGESSVVQQHGWAWSVSADGLLRVVCETDGSQIMIPVREVIAACAHQLWLMRSRN